MGVDGIGRERDKNGQCGHGEAAAQDARRHPAVKQQRRECRAQGESQAQPPGKQVALATVSRAHRNRSFAIPKSILASSQKE
jgi:hypothetical protein